MPPVSNCACHALPAQTMITCSSVIATLHDPLQKGSWLSSFGPSGKIGACSDAMQGPYNVTLDATSSNGQELLCLEVLFDVTPPFAAAKAKAAKFLRGHNAPA